MAVYHGEQQPVQQPAEILQGKEEEVRIKFVNPELLRAYILDPRPRTLAERLSHVRETSLGEFSLDGQLFESAKFTLLIEADPDPKGKRPTVIIRTDVKLGNKDSAIKRFQQAKSNNKNPKEYVWGKIRDMFDNDSLLRIADGKIEENDMNLVEWSENVARIYPHLERLDKEEEMVGQLRFVPLATLQLWDKDDDPDSISVSLFSFGRYSQNWMERYKISGQKEKDGWEVDKDAVDRWDFEQQVGIDVFYKEEFNESIRFFEESFSQILAALYKSEGITPPNLQYEIEPPLIFKEDEAVMFSDIGGQDNAVASLKALSELEKKNIRGLIGQGRSVLLEGPPGNGKSSLVKALANELAAPLVKKTSLDLPRGTTLDIIGLFELWHLEAKSMAKRSGGKAVYCIEGLEVFLQNPILHDMFLNILERWENDPEVLFIATTNFAENLHGGIRSRFSELPILPPNRRGIKEILKIHAGKIAKILGYDVFSLVDLDKVAQRIETNKNVSGREIVKFLGGAYSLGRLKSQPIDTDFILSLLPDERLGFRTR